jgi:hypothetical protein
MRATIEELAAALTEWERRAREEPQRFAAEWERAAMTPETYGEACAPYLAGIVAEIQAGGVAP